MLLCAGLPLTGHKAFGTSARSSGLKVVHHSLHNIREYNKGFPIFIRQRFFDVTFDWPYYNHVKEMKETFDLLERPLKVIITVSETPDRFAKRCRTYYKHYSKKVPELFDGERLKSINDLKYVYQSHTEKVIKQCEDMNIPYQFHDWDHQYPDNLGFDDKKKQSFYKQKVYLY